MFISWEFRRCLIHKKNEKIENGKRESTFARLYLRRIQFFETKKKNLFTFTKEWPTKNAQACASLILHFHLRLERGPNFTRSRNLCARNLRGRCIATYSLCHPKQIPPSKKKTESWRNNESKFRIASMDSCDGWCRGVIGIFNETPRNFNFCRSLSAVYRINIRRIMRQRCTIKQIWAGLKKN